MSNQRLLTVQLGVFLPLSGIDNWFHNIGLEKLFICYINNIFLNLRVFAVYKRSHLKKQQHIYPSLKYNPLKPQFVL